MPVTGDRDKAQESECSTSTEMRTTEAPRTVSEEDVSKLKDIDKALLNHFKGTYEKKEMHVCTVDGMIS